MYTVIYTVGNNKRCYQTLAKSTLVEIQLVYAQPWTNLFTLNPGPI